MIHVTTGEALCVKSQLPVIRRLDRQGAHGTVRLSLLMLSQITEEINGLTATLHITNSLISWIGQRAADYNRRMCEA